MARKVLTIFIWFFCLLAWGQKTKISYNTTAISDSTINSLTIEKDGIQQTLPFWTELRKSSETHVGFGIANGYNNTRYLKLSQRFKLNNFPIGVYQTVEYATNYRNLGYAEGAPLFRLPFGFSYQINEKITILTGVDIITKFIYDYPGIRKDLGVCFKLSKTQITVGYSFVMGPSFMIRIPAF